MGDQGLLAIIGGNTSLEDIVIALTGRSCKDFTSLIDPGECETLPSARGGFCDIFQGKTRNGERIAIKCLRRTDNLTEDEGKEILKRAARELYGWSKLKHHNVLPLMGLAVFREQLSMVSEWMENGHLILYIKNNPGADRIKLCIDVCSGISYIHSKNMAHGDLKGENIMVSRDGTAMIADFGTTQLNELTLKFTGTMKGAWTTRWAAPELFGEENHLLASEKADMYAYGMILLEALTGKHPFDELTEFQVMWAVAGGKIPSRPKGVVPDQIWELMESCWRRDCSSRPDSVSVGKEMKAYHDSLGNGPPGPAEVSLQKKSTGTLPRFLLILSCLIPLVAFYFGCQILQLCGTSNDRDMGVNTYREKASKTDIVPPESDGLAPVSPVGSAESILLHQGSLPQGSGDTRPQKQPRQGLDVPVDSRTKNGQEQEPSRVDSEVEWCRWMLRDVDNVGGGVVGLLGRWCGDFE